MEKKLIWFGLNLKIQLKRKITWLGIFCMVLLVWVVHETVLPDASNNRVAVCNEDGAWTQEIVDELCKKNDAFLFYEAQSAETVRQDVLEGKAECGFIICAGLEEGLRTGEAEELVCYVSSGLTTKGATVREVFYAELFAAYGEILLEQGAEEMFSEVTPEVLGELLTQYEEYRDSDKVFHVEYETVSVGKQEGAVAQTGMEQTAAEPVRGLAAVMIFLTMLLGRGADLTGQGDGYVNHLPEYKRPLFRLLRCLATGVFPAAAALLLYGVMGTAENWAAELGSMCLFLLISACWVLLFGRLLQKKTVYYSWCFTLVLANLILTPVFFDLGEWFPAFETISWFFPVGFYVKMI